MSLLVRPADPAEAADLQRLVRVTSLPPVDAEYVGSRHVFVAHEGNQLAGFFALHAGPSAWRLEHLWVAEASVGRGRGRWLFTDAVRRARRLGAE